MQPSRIDGNNQQGSFGLVVALLLSAVVTFALGPQPAASAATVSDTLNAGQQLVVGQSLGSTDGRYTAVMQGDGNFVVYGPGGAIWSTGGSSANRIVMQGDGNLVSYNGGGGSTWSSRTATSRNDRLVMQSDGNLVIYSGNNIALWSNGRILQGGDTLATNQQLMVGQALFSTDGRYSSVMQGDGNFVVYGPGGAVWSTGGSSANRIVMQGDGNLVSYNGGGDSTWSSGTAPTSNDRLVMQSDGNLVIYSGSNVALWSNGQLQRTVAAVLGLPFPAGSTWLAGAPHLTNNASLDFGPQNGAGAVVAAGPGTVRLRRCAGGNVIQVDHGGGWVTDYYHLTAIREDLNGQFVQAGTRLGDAGQTNPCGGSSTFNHVHFTILKDGVRQNADGLSIGGYTVRSDGRGDYYGYWTRNSDGVTVITNNGVAACCLLSST